MLIKIKQGEIRLDDSRPGIKPEDRIRLITDHLRADRLD